jgi:hypothetical protein
VEADVDETAIAAPPVSGKAHLFISHRHLDKELADVVRAFISRRSGGRVKVFQSSSAAAEGPRIGRQLNQELVTNIWAANMLILLYTTPDQDWSYCMWECGVALDAASPDTRIVVFKCAGQSPPLFAADVCVDIHKLVDLQKFADEFLTSPEFFPGYGQAVTDFMPDSQEVREAAQELYDQLTAVAPEDTTAPGSWPPYPFMQLQLSFDELCRIRTAPSAQRVAVTQEILENGAIVTEADSEARRLFGVRDQGPKALFAAFVSNWRESCPNADGGWVQALSAQIAAAALDNFPTQVWSLLRGVDRNDGTWYGPSLIRVQDMPRQRCGRFDVSFCKFELDEARRIVAAVPSG